MSWCLASEFVRKGLTIVYCHQVTLYRDGPVGEFTRDKHQQLGQGGDQVVPMLPKPRLPKVDPDQDILDGLDFLKKTKVGLLSVFMLSQYVYGVLFCEWLHDRPALQLVVGTSVGWSGSRSRAVGLPGGCAAALQWHLEVCF